MCNFFLEVFPNNLSESLLTQSLQPPPPCPPVVCFVSMSKMQFNLQEVCFLPRGPQ